jgi:hypothetical protein
MTCKACEESRQRAVEAWKRMVAIVRRQQNDKKQPPAVDVRNGARVPARNRNRS